MVNNIDTKKNFKEDKSPDLIENPVNSRVDKFSQKKAIFISAGIFLLVSVCAVYFLFANKSEITRPTLESDSNIVSSSKVAPTPFPFQEMTIPYLRDRKFESTMNDLNQISTNANYEEFLTSYDSDGFKINALLTRPIGQTPEGGFPAIIFIHGYIPPTTYVTNGQSYSEYVDYLARNGFVVFKIDLRGHGDSEGEANGAYYSEEYIVDVLNARAALRGLDFVNDSKIGLWGHSMAGNVVLRSIAAARDIPVAVIWAGAVYTYDDLQEYGLNDNSYRPPMDNTQRQRRRERLFATYGEFDSKSSFWKQVIPTNYLDGISTPIQLNHSVDDDVVDIGYSRGLNSILDNTLITHELNEYASGGHNISGSAYSQAMQNTIEFYNKFLK